MGLGVTMFGFLSSHSYQQYSIVVNLDLNFCIGKLQDYVSFNKFL